MTWVSSCLWLEQMNYAFFSPWKVLELELETKEVVALEIYN